MGEVENLDALQRLAGLAERLVRRPGQMAEAIRRFSIRRLAVGGLAVCRFAVVRRALLHQLEAAGLLCR